MLDIGRHGPVLRVTLDRPERRNAFDAALIARLEEAFSDVGDARVVVLTGRGPSFCAGADVDWQRASIDLSFEENVEDALSLHRMLASVDRCPAPVVAAVHGYALGGGSGLAACADTVVAAPDAVFGFTEVRLGIAPAVISPFVHAKIGARARRYFTTGERFDAATALRIGLVDELADDLDGAVARIVADTLQSGPEAVRAAKRLALERPTDGDELARIAAGLRASAEGQEGLRAFLEKRPARQPDGTTWGVYGEPA
jgi:methylglutaconyl-CoA hydratase